MSVSVFNIKIDGKPTEAGQVRLLNEYPLLTWEFSGQDVATVTDPPGGIDSISASSQSEYEIRVGTTITNQGTSSFVGDIASTGWVSSSSTQWRYRSWSISQGSSYYGQIRSRDEHSNTSNWHTFSFRVNALPQISNVVISPATPTAGDNLTLTYDFTDSDGDSEGSTLIKWFRNGVLERNLDGSITVDSSYLTANDEWVAEVTPHDGYTYGAVFASDVVSINSESWSAQHIISNAAIVPSSPTTYDPLYAYYNYTGDHDVQIRWHHNGSHVAEADNSRFYRFELEEGDTVFFEVSITDIDSSDAISSSLVTVTAPPFRVYNLSVDGVDKSLSVATTTPILTWDAISPHGKMPHVAQIKIGTSPYGEDVLNETVSASLGRYLVPAGILRTGADYYVSVAVGETSSDIGEYSYLHFRVAGSLWQEEVSNSTGWTIELVAKLISGSQGIRIADGSRFAQINLQVTEDDNIERVLVVAGNSESAETDLTDDFHTFIITGKNNTLQVFKDGSLLINMDDAFVHQTIDRYLEFGVFDSWTSDTEASSSSEGIEPGVASYKSLKYTVDGAYSPIEDADFYNYTFRSVLELDRSEITAQSSLNGDILISVESPDETSDIYLLDPDKQSLFSSTVSRSTSPVNQIVRSPDGRYTFFCHAHGATIFEGKPIIAYDHFLDLTEDDPEEHGWSMVATKSSFETNNGSSGLSINTLGGGQWFYTQDRKGTDWFDRVDNEKGWTLNFSLKVESIQDDSGAYDGISIPGSGIYVSDGAYAESIYFTDNRIIFFHSKIEIEHNSTILTDYRITCKGRRMQLFARQGSGTYRKIGDAQLSYRATPEGNGSRPSSAEDSHGETHAVWQDDGNAEGSQIMYSSTIDGNWSEPTVIVPANYNATSPKIVADGDRILVVFQTKTVGYSRIGIAILNDYGWSEPSIVVDNGFDTKNPGLSIDSSQNWHLIWEDHRHGVSSIYYARRSSDGQWGDETRISPEGTRCARPSIDTSSIYGAVVWTQYTPDGDTCNIHGRSFSVADNQWNNFSNASFLARDADYADVLVHQGRIHVVWHDSANGGYEIYYNRFNSQMETITNVVQLTSSDYTSRYPSIGVQSSTNKIMVVWEYNGELASDAEFAAFSPSDSSIRAAIWDGSSWYSSHHSGDDVVFSFEDARTARRPIIARSFSGSAHILYETEPVTDEDEYVVGTEEFTSIFSAVYDLTESSTYLVENTATDWVDHRVSGVVVRKEVRFGDFTDAINGNYLFSEISMVLSEDIEPWKIRVLSSGNADIEDNRSLSAIVNNNGDAWIGMWSGLAFYFKDVNKIATFHDGVLENKAIKRVTVSPDGIVLVAASNQEDDASISLYTSTNHIDFRLASISGFTGVTSVSEMAFDDDGYLWVSTNNGVFKLAISASNIDFNGTSQAVSMSIADHLTTTNGIPSNIALCLSIDSNGIIWIGTDAGLAKYDTSNGSVYNFTTSNSPILSNRVTGIAIRSNVIRYVATSAGLCEMNGVRLRRLETIDGTTWNNNLRALAWEDTGTLWVSNLSQVCMIQINDDTGLHRCRVFELSEYAPGHTSRSPSTYYIGDKPDDTNALAEVYVNGRRVFYGYTLSDDYDYLRFETSLKPSDIVYVIFRNDVSLYASTRQNIAEIEGFGRITSRINRMIVAGNYLYAEMIRNGTKQLFRYDTVNVQYLPYDSIVVDTTPPEGTITINRQLSPSTVLLDITGEDEISGVSQMIVSNFPNFTTDGQTPQSPVDFATQVIHTLDNSSTTGIVSKTFSAGDGVGRKIIYYQPDEDRAGDLYLGTAGPAKIFSYDDRDDQWSLAATLDTSSGASVEFMDSYQGKLIVGVGKGGGSATIYTSSNGSSFSVLASLSASHVYASANQGQRFYFGDSNGVVYSWNGSSSPSVAYNTGNGPIMAMEFHQNKLYIAKGSGGSLSNGRVLEINVQTDQQIVLWDAPDSNVTSLSLFQPDTAVIIYVGLGSKGEVWSRSLGTAGASWQRSYSGVPGRVQRIRRGDKEFVNIILKMINGTGLYEQTFANSLGQGWERVAYIDSDIKDFTAVENPDTGIFDSWLITEQKVVQVPAPTGEELVYLKLIDAAGNETKGDSIFDSISIEDLSGFLNENRIITLDALGTEKDSYIGEAPFYAASRSSRESGSYFSEIFFGTNNLLKWDLMTWDATTPEDTEVTLYVRAGDSRDAVLAADWSMGFTSNFSSGVDLGFLQGRYMQFRATLSTENEEETPLLSNVIIRSRTQAATHFYTTNFILGSRITRGILTSSKIVPVSADIIFGIDTNNSVEFADYQTIEPEQVFEVSDSQQGTGLRVGIKMITPTPSSYATDVFGEYGPGGLTLYTNTVYFEHTGDGSVYAYAVEFYNDAEMTDLVYSSTSADEGWTINGVSASGSQVVDGEADVAFVPTGESGLTCNTYYYIKAIAQNITADTDEEILTDSTFISGCNPTYMDTIGFDFVNEEIAAVSYHFRVRMYTDPERTEIHKVYYSGSSTSGWEADGVSIPSTGIHLEASSVSTISFSPPLSDMEQDTIYYLVIDAFNGSVFSWSSKEFTYRASDPTGDEYCGEYGNVPIIKGFAMMFELEGGRKVTLNL